MDELITVKAQFKKIMFDIVTLTLESGWEGLKERGSRSRRVSYFF